MEEKSSKSPEGTFGTFIDYIANSPGNPANQVGSAGVPNLEEQIVKLLHLLSDGAGQPVEKLVKNSGLSISDLAEVLRVMTSENLVLMKKDSDGEKVWISPDLSKK